MLTKMDTWMIEAFDRAAAALQRRGANLLAIKVWANFALFLVMVAGTMYVSGSPGMLLFTVLVFGWQLNKTVRSFKTNHDYPEVARRMQALNAEALREREMFRHLRVTLAVVIVVLDALTLWQWPWARIALEVGQFVALMGCWYLDCCFYLGPGEHSRESRRVGAGVEQRT